MAEAQKMHCTLAVPNREIFSGEVYYASVPSVEGQYGVLPGHELILSLNKEGGVCTLHLDAEGKETIDFLVYDGIAQVFDDRLTVLGRLGKLTSRIKLDEMKERFSAQEKVVEDLSASVDDTESAKLNLRLEEERLKWYKLQVDWAEHNLH